MRACIYIKKAKQGRSRGKCLSLIKHCLGEGRSEREYDDGNSRVVVMGAFGMAGHVDATKPADIRDNLLRHNHASKSKEAAKHVVISTEDISDPAARKAALHLLQKMAFEFLRIYAPGCCAVAFGHNDRHHPHFHLLIANSDSKKAIDWKPKILRQMQSLEWLSRDLAAAIKPGRKKPGKVKKDAYPLANLSAASELAMMIPSKLEQVPWITRGNTRVFFWKNRRIRERTIERERNKIHETASAIQPTNSIKQTLAGTNRQATIPSRAQTITPPETDLVVNGPGNGRSDAVDLLTATVHKLQGFRRKRITRISEPRITF